jgi:hypothetical protein
LEELHVHMTGVEDKRATEAGELSALVVETSNALVNLRMLPIRDVSQLPKMAHEILKAAGIILELLREEHHSGSTPWD